MRWLLPLPLLLVLAPGCARSADDARAARPDLVLLIADDMDWEHFGFLGHVPDPTPTLDRLAAAGAVFTHGFVPVSRCRPSQATLLTGLWPQQHGMYFNTGPGHIDPRNALPGLLREAGYATIGEGKFWEGDPRLVGFSNPSITNYETFVRQGQQELFDFIDATPREQPLFVWWAPQLPHVPHNPPQRLLERFDPATLSVPDWLQEPALREKFREREHRSLAMAAWLDEGVDELIGKLRASGRYENTLFVFLVDNGWANGQVSKGWALDKGLRTPVIFAWPAAIAGGQTFSELMSSADIYATLLDVAGLPLPAGCQGRSLRSRLQGGPGEPRTALYGALYPPQPTALPPDPGRDATALWARTERWKYILSLQDVRMPAEGRSKDEETGVIAILDPGFERDRGDQELYDLESDPQERHNLAGDPGQAERLRELRAACLDWWRSTGGAPLDLPR